MPIPGFNSQGLLPPFLGPENSPARSPYHATITEFVEHFATSLHRVKLIGGLLGYRAMLAGLGYVNGLQFLDGSFVEQVEVRESRPPGDIDVFSYLVRPDKYRQDPTLWASGGLDEWQREIVDAAKNKSRFHLDTYGLADDNFDINVIIDQTIYWYSLFSHRRTTFEWKGFVRVPLSPQDDAAATQKLKEIENKLKKEIEDKLKKDNSDGRKDEESASV
jgi:hypothetical protein